MMDSNLPRLIGKRVCWLVSCPIHRYGCMTVKWSTQIVLKACRMAGTSSQ